MSATDLVLQCIRVLDQLSIPYMLVGAYSSNYYGRPRSTDDADFVVLMNEEQFPQFRNALGPAFQFDPQMSFETITMHSRHIATHSSTAFVLELFLLANDPFSQSQFKRRRLVDFDGHPAWLPSPEDVIVQKLLWSKSPNRPQDITDATNVILMQKDLGLDLAYIRHWTDRHGTRDLFERLFAQAT